MPYTPTNWIAGSTPLSQNNLNNLEKQYFQATYSFEQDLFLPFVLRGIAPSADGTIVNQLDTTSGTAFIRQSDSTLYRISVAASTTGQFTTSTPNTTYYLDLNPDGSWSWGTSHSTQTNYLPICQVVTNASGNISSVIDERTLNTSLLSSMWGNLDLPPLYNGLSVKSGTTSLDNGGITTDGAGNITAVKAISSTGLITVNGIVPGSGQTNYLALQKSGDTTPRISAYIRSDAYGGIGLGAGGAAYAVQLYGTSTGLTIDHPTVINGQLSATTFYGASGAFTTDSSGRITNCNTITCSGSMTMAGLITANGGMTVATGKSLTLSGTANLSVGGASSLDNGAITTNGSGNLTLGSGALSVKGSSSLDNGGITSDGNGNLTVTRLNVLGASGNFNLYTNQSYNIAGFNYLYHPSGTATGYLFQTWNGTSQVNLFSIGVNTGTAYVDSSGNYNGPAGGGIPTTRNGTATSAPVYSGTTSPSSPPTGSIWVKA